MSQDPSRLKIIAMNRSSVYVTEARVRTPTEVKVASRSITEERRSARIALVERHIRLENEHDLEGVLGTFGDTARYEDEPWGEQYEGRNGVRQF